MTLAAALATLLQGLQADRQGCARLHALLEQQFQAALRHQPEELAVLGAAIERAVDAMAAGGRQRAGVLRRLLGGGEIGMQALLQRLPAAQAQRLQPVWQALQTQLQECKALNARNCRLITEQHALMQRVLGVEEALYAEP